MTFRAETLPQTLPPILLKIRGNNSATKATHFKMEKVKNLAKEDQDIDKKTEYVNTLAGNMKTSEKLLWIS